MWWRMLNIRIWYVCSTFEVAGWKRGIADAKMGCEDVGERAGDVPSVVSHGKIEEDWTQEDF